MMNTFQDLTPVNIGRGSINRPIVVPKSAAELARAKQAGIITTEKKFGAGGNQSAHAPVVSARTIEKNEDLKHMQVDASLSKAIMQARMAKKMTQKDLGVAINEKQQIVADYEAGRGIPNPQIISKLERALNCKLPRPQKPKKMVDDVDSGIITNTTSANNTSKIPANDLTRGGPPRV